MFRALVAGHLCIDLTPPLTRPPDVRPGTMLEVGPLRLSVGGCVANTGGDLAALGAPVRLAADVGDDELADLLRQRLAARTSAPASLVALAGVTTSYTVVVQPPDADRAFWHHVGANGHFDGTRVEFSGEDLLHLGYPMILPALLPETARPLRELLDRARRAGLTTSLDLAVIDPRSAAGRLDWSAILARSLPLVDVLTPSIDDLAASLHRSYDRTPAALSAAAAELLAAGVAVVALTAGADGLLLRTAGKDRLRTGGRVLAAQAEAWADRELWVQALPADQVRTTGAGDAATAGLLYGLLAGLDPEAAAVLAAAVAAERISGREVLAPYGDGTAYAVPVPHHDEPGWTRGPHGALLGPWDRAVRPVE